MTTGCTKESCHFRDLASEFAALGAQRVGISSDPVGKQKEFSKRYAFDYPLLSDADGTVATTFGVRRSGGRAKRATFVIAPDSTVRAVIRSELRMNVHADQALAALHAGSPG